MGEFRLAKCAPLIEKALDSAGGLSFIQAARACCRFCISTKITLCSPVLHASLKNTTSCFTAAQMARLSCTA